MKRKGVLSKRARQRLLQMCDAIGEDDLIDPREYFKSRSNGHRGRHRKSYQLCRQVRETLELVLAGECHDELLQAVRIDSVVPAPNASQLLVIVGCRDAVFEARKEEMLSRLVSQTGWLRSRLAETIHRKHVPKIRFAMIGL